MLADYMRQQQQQEQQMGDFGYYDDFAPDEGEEVEPEVEPEVEEEVFVPPPPPPRAPAPPRAPPRAPAAPAAPAAPTREEMAEQMGLSLADFDVYMRTGNLPTRRRGRGVLKISHGESDEEMEGGRCGGKKPKKALTGRRADRAAIVKKVMRERGVKLGEASRIVKAEGLF